MTESCTEEAELEPAPKAVRMWTSDSQGKVRSSCGVYCVQAEERESNSGKTVSRPTWLERKGLIKKSERLLEQQINMAMQTFKNEEDELEMGRLIERLMET